MQAPEDGTDDKSSVSKQSNLHPQMTPEENVQQRRRRQQEMRMMVLNIQHNITKWASTRSSFHASRSAAAEVARQGPRRVTTPVIPCLDSRIQTREPRTKHLVPEARRHAAERGRGSPDIEEMGLISAECFLIVLQVIIVLVYCDAVLASMMSSLCAASLICIIAFRLRAQRDWAD